MIPRPGDSPKRTWRRNNSLITGLRSHQRIRTCSTLFRNLLIISQNLVRVIGRLHRCQQYEGCQRTVWLANCYFADNSLRFPALLPFFNASSLRPFHPPNRRPDPVVPTRRRPFPRCRVPSSQTPTPDPESLPTPISQSILVGPHPCRLDGALDPSYSSSPFRNRSEAFDTAWPSQSLEQAKVPRAVLPESPTEARPERSERRASIRSSK